MIPSAQNKLGKRRNNKFIIFKIDYKMTGKFLFAFVFLGMLVSWFFLNFRQLTQPLRKLLYRKSRAGQLAQKPLTSGMDLFSAAKKTQTTATIRASSPSMKSRMLCSTSLKTWTLTLLPTNWLITPLWANPTCKWVFSSSLHMSKSTALTNISGTVNWKNS